MDYKINFFAQELKTTIKLPASKSLSNRLLIINALSGNQINLENLSTSDDTLHLINALNSENELIDVGHAGTSMRFLTAYFALSGKNKILTGSERMKNRPIGILVESLNQLGAKIEYLEKQGFPPLKIHAQKPFKSKIEIAGNISSQYISALLLLSPALPQGLEITLTGKIVSLPYIQMTLNMMHAFGINYTWRENKITIEPQNYQKGEVFVESDWSGASYWFEIMALAPISEIELFGLHQNSFQGDSKLTELFENLGVQTSFYENKVKLVKTELKTTFFEYDFNLQPDIAQTFAVSLCLLNIPFHFYGLETLKIKETNRIEALMNELQKLGFSLNEPCEGELEWKGTKSKIPENQTIEIETYNDHRMALAFAPAAVFYKNLIVKNAEVVSKSYPEFWQHIAEIGFLTQQV